jgi:hypothetical protein
MSLPGSAFMCQHTLVAKQIDESCDEATPNSSDWRKSLLYEVGRQYGPLLFFGPTSPTKWLPRGIAVYICESMRRVKERRIVAHVMQITFGPCGYERGKPIMIMKG